MNIRPLETSIDKIMKLRGVRFFWKNDKEIKKMDIGFIAQEVRHVIPEFVANGEGEYLTVKYENVVAVSLKAIKEQHEKLNQSQRKLEKLELIAKEKGLI